MLSNQVSSRKNILYVVGRVFVEGAYTPVVSLEIISVCFAILNERAKQMKR
jgi:hypothetical protein